MNEKAAPVWGSFFIFQGIYFHNKLVVCVLFFKTLFYPVRQMNYCSI